MIRRGPVRLWGAILVVLALLLSTTACGSAGNATGLQRIKSDGVLRVGIGVSPPLTIRNGDGSYEGLDVDLIRMFAEELGVRVEFVGTSYTTIIAGLQSGKYDMITSLQAREERKRAVDFADPLLNMGGAWLVPKSRTELDSVESLNDPSVTISCLAGGAQCLICKKVVPKAVLREVPSAGAGISELIVEIGSGRADALAVEALITPALVQKFPQYRIVPEDPEGVDPVPVGWSVRKGSDELLGELNRFVNERVADGTVEEQLTKWVTPENSLRGT